MPPLWSAPACATSLRARRLPSTRLKTAAPARSLSATSRRHKARLFGAGLSAPSHRGRSPSGAAFLFARVVLSLRSTLEKQHVPQIQDPSDGAPCPCADI